MAESEGEQDHVLDALVIRRDELLGKRAARANAPGFAQNVQEIDRAVAQLETSIAERENAAQHPTSQD